jgi:hypothetical protein
MLACFTVSNPWDQRGRFFLKKKPRAIVLCFKETKKRINRCCEQHYIGKKGTTGFEFSPLPVALHAHRMAAVG